MTKKPQTHCRGCQFAMLEPEGEQSGCLLFGRLDKFLEREEAHWDEEGQYYLIDRVCNGKTSQDQSPDERRNLITLRVDMIVFVHECDNVYELCEQRANEILQQDLLPKRVAFVLDQEDVVDPTRILNICQHVFVDSKIEYRVISPLINKWQSVDNFVKKSKSNYYALFKVDKEIPRHFCSRLDFLFNDELMKFITIQSPSGHGEVYATKINFHLGGHSLVVNDELYNTGPPKRTLIDKIKMLSQEKESILEWTI